LKLHAMPPEIAECSAHLLNACACASLLLAGQMESPMQRAYKEWPEQTQLDDQGHWRFTFLWTMHQHILPCLFAVSSHRNVAKQFQQQQHCNNSRGGLAASI
jgi:hypothetical protein